MNEFAELTKFAKSYAKAWCSQNPDSAAAFFADSDHVIEQLKTGAEVQNGVHYDEQKLSPQWDALRTDSRFEKIVNSLAPK